MWQLYSMPAHVGWHGNEASFYTNNIITDIM